MIRIGNQTAISAASVIQPFEYAGANGFDAFEWFPDKKESGAGWEEGDLSEKERAFIKDTALTNNISLSVHAPLQSNHFSKTIEFAQDIGASLINIHLNADQGIAAFADTAILLAKQLADAGIRLSIENTPDNGPDDFNELFDRLGTLILRVLSQKESTLRINVPKRRPLPWREGDGGGVTNVPLIGMCFDIGHANLYHATRNDYLKFIDLLSPDVPVIHIHMHENYGDYDSHLPLFTGPAGQDPAGITGFVERIKKRNFSGCIILEQWPHPAGLLNNARSRLLEIIGQNSTTEDTE